MCARFDLEQKLIKDITNNDHTSLYDIKFRIGNKILKNLKIFKKKKFVLLIL